MPNQTWGLQRGHDELQHWGWGKKRSEKKDHKYIKREWKDGKWIYTYFDKKLGHDKTIKSLTKLADWAGADEKVRLQEAKDKQTNAEFRAKSTAKAANSQNNFKNLLDRDWSQSAKNEILTGNFKSQDKYSYNEKQAVRQQYLLSGQAEGFVGTGQTNNNVTSSQRAAGEARNAASARAETAKAQRDYDKTLLGKIDKGKQWLSNLFTKKKK